MGTGQTLLTIMAMIMLSRLILSVNAGTAESGDSIQVAAYRITATSLGSSMIEQATGMAFDAKSDTVGISNPSNFSTTLGKETGEVYPDFDDFDDFNNLHRVDSLTGSAVFNTDVKVEYVSIVNNVITVSASPTYSKRITVSVSSKSMRDTLKFYSLFSYWFFR